MATFITRFADHGTGLAVAVKDLIDVTGTVTTAGCKALAETAAPAQRDASCLREIRRREAAGELWLVGKTNLHELAYGVSGVNPWFGTPVNPRFPDLLPGGSSSGSATAVAAGDADIGLGTDTGGSVRIPAACCGIAGLKTTWGRIPATGVWPLAPSLDTVGPLARDVAGLVAAMQLFEPDFATGDATGLEVGRVRLDGEQVNPAVDAAVDRALAAAELAVTVVTLAGWSAAWEAGDAILSAEAWRQDGPLLEAHPDGIGDVTAQRIAGGAAVTVEAETAARRTQLGWQRELEGVLTEVHVLALPVLRDVPPPVGSTPFGLNRLTLPFNVAGLPAVAVPIGVVDGRPVSLQLAAPAYGEEMLLSLAAVIEAAVTGD
jgi:amidase